MRLLLIKEVADMLRIQERVLYKSKVRERMGLPTIKIGGRLRFREDDVQRLISEGREVFDGTTEAANL